MCKINNEKTLIQGFGFCLSESEENLWRCIFHGFNLNEDQIVRKGVNISISDIEYDQSVISSKVIRRMDKQVIYQLIATDRLFKKCHKFNKKDADKIGVFSGSLFAQLEFGMSQMKSLITSGNKNDISMYTGVSFYYGATCGEVSLLLGSRGENLTICTGANSGLDCIIEGHSNVKRKINHLVFSVAGENLSEEVISEMLPHQRSGENIIKEESYIYRSGAICALLGDSNCIDGEVEIISTCQVNDSSSLYSCGDDFKEVFQYAIEHCLDSAQITAQDIDLIIPGINNSIQYDTSELQVLQALFKNRKNLLYTPIPTVGDYLSASGLLKAYVACLCIKHRCIPQNRISDFNRNNIKPYEALFNWEHKNEIDVHYAMVIQRDVVSGRISILVLRKSI